jgi:hypothetical protein
MYIRPLAITGELRKVPMVHILPNLAVQVPRGWAPTTDRLLAHPEPLRYHGHRIAITPPQDRHNLLVREL